MKHLYRNILCILLILVALSGILLMCLHLNGFLDDNLNIISKSISNGESTIYDLSKPDLKKEVMTVDSDYNGLIYLRNESGADFNPDSGSITDAKDYKGDYSYNPLGYYARKNKESGSKAYSLTIKSHKKSENMLIPNYSYQGLDSEYKRTASDFRVRATMEKDVPYDFDFYPEVDTDSFNSVELPADVLQDELDYREYVHSNYTHLVKNYNEKDANKVKQEEQLREEVLGIIKEKGLDINSSSFVEDVHDYFMKNYEYNLKGMDPVAPKGEKDIILYFLKNSTKGCCNNFASASLYLYRAAGIPTRFVTGYLAMGAMPVNGKYHYSVTAMYCHAWNEVYIDGAGWKRVDNTASRMDLSDINLDDYQGIISNVTNPDISIPDISIPDTSKPSDSSSDEKEDKYKIQATLHNIQVTYDGIDHEFDEKDFNEYFKIDSYEDPYTGSIVDNNDQAATFVLGNTYGYKFTYKFKKKKSQNHIDATDIDNDIPPYHFVCEIHVVNKFEDNCDDEFEFEIYNENETKSIGGLEKTKSSICIAVVNKADVKMTYGRVVSLDFNSDGEYINGNDISDIVVYNSNFKIDVTCKVILKSSLKLSDFDENHKYKVTEFKEITFYDSTKNIDITKNLNIDTSDFVITLDEFIL